MHFDNVLAHLDVTDLDRALAWYERFFGRPADRRPMDGTAEWQLSTSGGIQIYRADGPAATVVLGVADVDGAVTEVNGRGIDAAVDEKLSGKFQLAFVYDPDGNTIILSSRSSTVDQ